MELAIAFDIGHSQVKLAIGNLANNERHYINFPTSTVLAMEIAHASTKKMADEDTVMIDGCRYFFGETALQQGRSNVDVGHSLRWVEETSHDVLVLGAWKKILPFMPANLTGIQLSLGLPSIYFASQRKLLRQRVLELLMPGLRQGVSLNVSVFCQAEGPLQWRTLLPDGTLNPGVNMDDESWAVVEVGHYSTDFAFYERGSMIQFAEVSCRGLSDIYIDLDRQLTNAGYQTSRPVLEQAIQNKNIKKMGETIDISNFVDEAARPTIGQIMETAVRVLHKDADTMDGIILAGGGAPLLFPDLKARFNHVTMPPNPRHIVSEGFCRAGLMILRQRKLANSF